MRKITSTLLCIIFFNCYGQSYKEKQSLTFKDETKETVIINEFLVYNRSRQLYVPYEIKFVDFYDYHKNPLGIRYFNFGCIKTKQSGFWLGQIDKDKFGHAIFKSPLYGIRTMVILNAEIIEKRGKNTLFKFFNVYAPNNDCVGSIKDDKGNCLYGYNKPEQYAQKVADALGIQIHDSLVLRDSQGSIDLKLMTLLVSEVAKFETGKNCKFEQETVEKAMAILE